MNFGSKKGRRPHPPQIFRAGRVSLIFFDRIEGKIQVLLQFKLFQVENPKLRYWFHFAIIQVPCVRLGMKDVLQDLFARPKKQKSQEVEMECWNICNFVYLFHKVVDALWRAFRSFHPVPFFHMFNHICQRYSRIGNSTKRIDFP